VFFECSAEWILYWMHRMDDDWEWAKDFPQISGMLRMAPSEYIRRNCYVTCEADEPDLRRPVAEIGEDHILMASDYPHFDSEFSAHRFKHPRTRGPHRASEGQDPRRERSAPAAALVLSPRAASPPRSARLAIAPASFAVEPTPGILAVASYQGADRTGRLIGAARKEGELMLYSSLTQDDQLKLVADFKRRYGVTVKFWRGSQAHILQRVLSETRGGRFEFDVLETNAPQIEVLARKSFCRR